jgi:tetratricopeptide (TPR) repeat protein/predicted Ser/Thr protein kinase
MIAHFRIIEHLGSGSMGVLFKAEDTRLKRFVALKFLPGDLARSTSMMERFRREAQIASALNHPNICTVYDIGERQGRSYIVMEYLEGTNLRDYLHERRLSLTESINVGIEIAEGLSAAHRAGIVHRDVKPANLFRTNSGLIKILDFGLAKAESAQTGMTQTGAILGTLAYMAPEQFEGRPVDARADLYSVGVVLYEMATQSRPAVSVQPNAQVPPALRPILAKCLQPDREARYQSASELRDDLQRVRDLSPHKKRRTAAIVLGAAAAIAAAAIVYSDRQGPKLTDRDTIVLADFVNRTDESVFDGTLSEGLALELRQSPFLSMVPDQRIRQTLALMGLPENTALTANVANQICQRTGSAAYVEGSVAKVGNEYVLALQAKGCQTGQILDSEQARAANQRDVLNALGEIARKFRTRIGESLASVDRHQAPLAEVTTPSLEALKAYSFATRVRETNGDPKAGLALLEKAVQIDPEFAMAYATAGNLYWVLGETDLSAAANRKAFALRGRTSDRERFVIESNYYVQSAGNFEKAQETGEAWAEAYPRDREPYDNLTWIYQQLGEYEKSLNASKRMMELDPSFPPGPINLAWSYVFLDRLPEAEKVLQQAGAKNIKAPDLLILPYYIAFLKNDPAGMNRAANAGTEKAVAADWITHLQSMIEGYSCQVQQARVTSHHAVDLARRAGTPERAASYEAAAAVREAFFGNAAEALRRESAALSLSKARDVEYGAALTLLLLGDSRSADSRSADSRSADSRSAEPLIADLAKRFPDDTSVQVTYLPTIKALAALRQGEGQRALELLKTTSPYELGIPGSWAAFFGNLYPIYVRGLADIATHRPKEAAVEFQRILDHPGIVFADPVGVMARLQLARALAASGDKANARKIYSELLSSCSGGDPDLPVVQQAKTELGAL